MIGALHCRPVSGDSPRHRESLPETGFPPLANVDRLVTVSRQIGLESLLLCHFRGSSEQTFSAISSYHCYTAWIQSDPADRR